MRLLAKVNTRLGWNISVRDIYQYSTPASMGREMTSRIHVTNLESDSPHKHMELHSRENSRATLVLVHGFWGQGIIFSGLVPLVDNSIDVLILHDPFFARAEGPRTVQEWASFYLSALKTRIPPDHTVILGGYSLGGLIALKMASMWHELFASDPASLILLDPGTYEPSIVNEMDSSIVDKEMEYAFQLLGRDQKAYVLQHFKKLGPLMRSLTEKPDYHGTGLYIASNEAVSSGVAQWWKTSYPDLHTRKLGNTHHTFFDKSVTKELGRAINDHCIECLGHPISA
jgi:thioesterase domain-containing protein